MNEVTFEQIVAQLQELSTGALQTRLKNGRFYVNLLHQLGSPEAAEVLAQQVTEIERIIESRGVEPTNEVGTPEVVVKKKPVQPGEAQVVGLKSLRLKGEIANG